MIVLIVFGLFAVPLATAVPNVIACVATVEVLRDVDFEVGVTRYIPAKVSDRLVIVVPPTGGTTRIDLSYGEEFCKRGIASLVVNRWTDDQEYNLELSIHDRYYRRAQRALDLVLANSWERKIGILGTSVGALHAAIAEQRTDRIDSIFLIVGGAPISTLLATSDQKILADAKAARFKIYGFRSTDEYEVALKKVIPFEPLEINPAKLPKHFGMVISNSDGTVPTRNQIILKNAWNPSLVIESNWGHIPTIVKTWLCEQSRILEFFELTL